MWTQMNSNEFRRRAALAGLRVAEPETFRRGDDEFVAVRAVAADGNIVATWVDGPGSAHPGTWDADALDIERARPAPRHERPAFECAVRFERALEYGGISATAEWRSDGPVAIRLVRNEDGAVLAEWHRAGGRRIRLPAAERERLAALLRGGLDEVDAIIERVGFE